MQFRWDQSLGVELEHGQRLHTGRDPDDLARLHPDFSTMAGLTLAGWAFRGATIANCDLRGTTMTDCTGVAFDARDNRVDGLAVSASMAADLLSPLGITVR